MWSDKYIYYNIQNDLDFSQKVEVEKVVQLLLDTNCLVQEHHQSFENSDNFLWLDITIAMTENGNFKVDNKPLSHVNLISIVCSKGDNIDQSVYTNVFLNIAEKLNWKLFLEEDDFGNENIEIKR
ncbi:MAG: hypothetical protein LBV72_12400 [Tannerella sp.]|jgi:hypothetical protein|nr:hypothetical protein [Tannerella sp.]